MNTAVNSVSYHMIMLGMCGVGIFIVVWFHFVFLEKNVRFGMSLFRFSWRKMRFGSDIIVTYAIYAFCDSG